MRTERVALPDSLQRLTLSNNVCIFGDLRVALSARARARVIKEMLRRTQ